MKPTRHRFSGTASIISFNRAKYAAAAIAVIALGALATINVSLRMPLLIANGTIVIGVIASLGVSYWVYDALKTTTTHPSNRLRKRVSRCLPLVGSNGLSRSCASTSSGPNTLGKKS